MTETPAFTEAVREILDGLRQGNPSHARLNGAAFRIDQLGRKIHGFGWARDGEIAECFTAAVRELGGSHELPEEARGGAVDQAIRHLDAALAHIEQGGTSAAG